MTAAVLGVVLAAALLHAGWNASAHGTRDRLVGFTLINVAATAFGIVTVCVTGAPPPGLWVFVVGSAALHVVYQLLLMLSYRLGEFSQAYPLARGTSPWVVAVVSIVVLRQPMPVLELLGVLTISAGLLSLVLVGGRPSRAQVPGLVAAAATGLAIAGYTVVDGVAVRRMDVLTYAGWIFLLQGPALPLLAVARRRSALVGQLRPSLAVGLGGGVVSLLAYGLVLWAQQRAPLPTVAALRETSIVFGALIGRVFLGERLGAGRAWCAGAVVAGIVLVDLA